MADKNFKAPSAKQQAKMNNNPAIIEINKKIQKLMKFGYKFNEIMNRDPYTRTYLNKMIDQYLFQM